MRLRDWVKNALINTLALLCAVPIYMVLFEVGNEDFAWEDLFLLATVYLLVFSILVNSLLATNAYKMVLPVALSFGSTRREAVVGCQVYRLLPLILITPLSFLTAYLYDPDFCLLLLSLLPAILGAYLFFGAFGAFLGTAMVKFGNKVNFVMIPLCIALGAGMAFAAFSTEGFSRMPELITGDWFVWLVLGVGVIFHGLSMIHEVKTVYHCNVKL